MSLDSVDLLGNGKVVKEILRKGEGDEPQLQNEVEVHYVGTLPDGTEFDSSRKRDAPFTFQLGCGQVIKGWDVGVASMKVGELAKLIIQPDFAYGEAGSPPTIPPNSVLHFEVELLSFRQKKKEKWSMNSEERLQGAIDSKAEGNEHFRANRWAQAIAAYKEGAELLDGTDDWVEDLEQKATPLKLSLQLNLAQVYLKCQSWLEASIAASAALAVKADSSKALYRRGLARTQLGEYDEAKHDLLLAAKLEPQNAEIRAAIAECKKAFQNYKKTSAATYQKMFAA